jgi:hypothetical protein
MFPIQLYFNANVHGVTIKGTLMIKYIENIRFGILIIS